MRTTYLQMTLVSALATAALACLWLCIQVQADDREEATIRRIWQKEIGDRKRIAVDEYTIRGSPTHYVWRRLDAGKEDGPELLVVFSTMKVGTIPDDASPISVLYTNLAPTGDLITVYNQGGKSWGTVARVGAMGVIETMPGKFDFAPTHSKPTITASDRS